MSLHISLHEFIRKSYALKIQIRDLHKSMKYRAYSNHIITEYIRKETVSNAILKKFSWIEIYADKHVTVRILKVFA
jgi:hypothetical protein